MHVHAHVGQGGGWEVGCTCYLCGRAVSLSCESERALGEVLC